MVTFPRARTSISSPGAVHSWGAPFFAKLEKISKITSQSHRKCFPKLTKLLSKMNPKRCRHDAEQIIRTHVKLCEMEPAWERKSIKNQKSIVLKTVACFDIVFKRSFSIFSNLGFILGVSGASNTAKFKKKHSKSVPDAFWRLLRVFNQTYRIFWMDF